MRAMVLERPGTMTMRDRPDPQPGAGQAVLHVEAAGFCGSELHAFHSPAPRILPLIMGHEFTGRTAAGSRVVVNPLITCGLCLPCVRGRSQLCEVRAIIGIDLPGAFAERVVVPQQSMTELGESVTPEAGTLIEPMANAVHAWRQGRTRDGDRVAIIGAGPIGLMATHVGIQLFGIAPVVLEPVARRAELALRLRAEAAYSTTEAFAAENLPFDVVIDAVGSPSSRATAVAAVRAGGTVVCIGLASPDLGVDGQALVRYEKAMVGSFCYTAEDFSRAIDLARTVDVDWIEVVPFAAAATTFTDLATGRSGIVKAVTRP